MEALISSVLDQVQKLFGRGFLIAALIPSLVFLAALQIIWYGFSGLRNLLTRWAEGGVRPAAADLILALAGLYLLAYTVYGVRAAIHRAYQGRWPALFRRFSRSGLFEAAAKRRRRRHLDERTSALDIPEWADRGFGAAYSDQRPDDKRLRRLLTLAERDHRKVKAKLERGKSLEEQSYWRLLAYCHLLRASAPASSPQLQQRIDVLLDAVRDSYSENEQMRVAVRGLRRAADRDRILAYQDFVSTFPIDDRWLRPTRLGNVVSVVEGSTLGRYGITLDDLWPRLMHVTPAEARTRVEDANIYLDFTVVMSLLSLTLVVASGLAAVYGPPKATLAAWLAPALSFLSFWIFYRIAIQAARGFVLQVEAVVDLFRLKLLDALDIERPRRPDEEKAIWTEIRRFIVQQEIPKEHVEFASARERSELLNPADLRRPTIVQRLLNWISTRSGGRIG